MNSYGLVCICLESGSIFNGSSRLSWRDIEPWLIQLGLAVDDLETSAQFSLIQKCTLVCDYEDADWPEIAKWLIQHYRLPIACADYDEYGGVRLSCKGAIGKVVSLSFDQEADTFNSAESRKLIQTQYTEWRSMLEPEFVAAGILEPIDEIIQGILA